MAKTILITGATAGFGEATARIFARNGFRVVITGRRKDRLDALAKELSELDGAAVFSLCFDVRDKAACFNNIASLPEEWQNIDILVNNAGLASGLDKVQDADIDDWDKMVDTNVKGLLYVSKAVLPLLRNSEHAHIINIGSTAGKEVYERGSVYCATKHAVDAISKAMRIDLLEEGIKVSQICPGAAETEFSEVRFHQDKARAKAAYNGYAPMTADDIASIIYYVATLPPNLCVNDLVVTSLAQANSFYINRKN